MASGRSYQRRKRKRKER